MNARAIAGLPLSAVLLTLFFSLFAVGTLQAREKISLKTKGLALNANLQLAKGKALSDGVVLLTHGTLAHNEMEIIANLQDLLSERGRNSLAINLSLGVDNRKSAMYDCPVPHRHHYLDAVDEISAWVDWLKSKGVTKISILGHSRGGAQSATYAAQQPDVTIKNVILIAPATWSQQRSKDNYQKRYNVELAPLLTRAEKLVSDGQGRQIMKDIGFLYCANISATASSFVSYYKPDPRRHTPNLLKDIKLPTLVIAGTRDKIVKGLAEAVKPLVDGQKLQLRVIDDAGHYFRDFAGEEVADAIDEFLAP
jgi:pimeloyl-ACP methyl ester carboxylesterase